MPLEDYIKYYQATSITVETDKKKYRHTSYSYDFTNCQYGDFFNFTITEPIQLDTHTFSISVAQNGKRLQNYRLLKNAWEPS